MRRALVLFALTLPLLWMAEAQVTVPNQPSPGDASVAHPGEERPPTREEAQMRRNQQRQMTKANYEQMRKDADQLLKLATELKHYVDSAGENTLSLEVVKKTDQIEKLSKDIRNKMRSE